MAQYLEDWLDGEVAELSKLEVGELSNTFFFRDPMRPNYIAHKHFYSPADGTILYEQPTIASPPNSIEIEVKVAHHAGLTFYMNRRGTDATYGKGTSTIILQEIAG